MTGDTENQLTNRFYEVSCVIPAYNEEKRISIVMGDLCYYIYKNNLNWNIIISIDGDDNTENIIKEYSKRYNFIKIDTSISRSGKGTAIKRGLMNYHSILHNTVILMDADNSIKLSDIVDKLKFMKNNDAMILNRYNKANYIPFLRKFLGRSFNILIKGILRLKINDTQSGYKVYKTDVLMAEISKISIGNAFFDISLLYHTINDGYKITEIDTKYGYDTRSSFHISRLTIDMFFSLFAFAIRHSKFYAKIPDRLKEFLLHIYLKYIDIQ